MNIMKFGGSSVRDAERIENVCNIVINKKESKKAVVLSAMKGVTDLLIKATKLSEKNKIEYKDVLNEIKTKHIETIRNLITDKDLKTEEKVLILLKELEDVLKGIYLIKECSLRSLDFVLSFGERLSCTIVSDYMKFLGFESEMIDAREMISTNSVYGNAEVKFSETMKGIKDKFNTIKGIPIVTGFIASSNKGVTTTLGRNGSDYTASLLGAALSSEMVEIWTDVDGVLSSDPRIVKNAFVIPEITIQEAMELSFFGAEVIHPCTMIPCVEQNIPIKIKNTMNPSAPGTIIKNNIKRHNNDITGIASIENVALINIEGGGMLGKPGIASRVFQVLAESKINVIMISQASSEHSICIIVREAVAKKAIKNLKSELEFEIENKQIQNFELLENLESVSIIGENMRGTPGISGKLFSSLGKENINVLAIAQGSSERNISFVISKDDKIKAVNTIHKAFLEKVK